MKRQFSSLINCQPEAFSDLLAVAMLRVVARSLIDNPSLELSIGNRTSHCLDVNSVSCMSKYLKSRSKLSLSPMRSESKNNLSDFNAFNPRLERKKPLPIDSDTDSRKSAFQPI